MFLRKLLLMGLLAVLLSACGGTPMPVVDADMGDTPVPEADTPKATDVPAAENGGVSAQVVLDALEQDVLRELGLGAEEELALVSYEPVTWNDASLGCPEPDMMYAQVLSPGYLVIFNHDGEDIEVHATSKLTSFVICGQVEDADTSVPSLPLAASSEHPAVVLSLNEMTETYAVDEAAIALLDVTEEEWPNSCLGCAGKEEMCLSVITPGFRVTLVYAGEIYEYHTDSGRVARLCDVTKY